MGGSKKGGGSSHTPVEAKETGRSFQVLRILEVLSEGEIHGLVDDMGSVYLDKTPLQNKDGSYNFKNVSVYANAGTQNQNVLQEFNSVEKEVDVNAKVLYEKPITKTVSDVNVNRIRMTLGVERLLAQKDNGDTTGAEVSFKIDILQNNRVVSTRDYSFNGKYSNAYREMFEMSVPKPPFQIRVTRMREDSTTNKLQNGTFWSSYTEIIDQAFAYPNTALVGIKIDSEYFSSIPTRNYEIYGLMVNVPSNYDPFSHTYTSDFWDGSFKRAWTNNPAWIFYDLVTNTRYGMGQRLADFGIDKWQLYAIGRYCDELVPDGFGGTEPRMTCNIWITSQRKAYELINDIASIFRAMPVWNGQALTAIQDRASDPVWTYNNSNTIGGFTRQRSAKKARHNVIQVEYIDADDFYEKKVESVSDDRLVARFGQNVKKVTAFGCTSRGQAYRTGRWLLETEKLETETITFTVGQEGIMHLPYDIIEVADSQYAGKDIGGRILAVNGTEITLDRTIEIDNESYLSYVSKDAITENVKIVSFDKNTNVATVAKSLAGTPEMSVWALSTRTLTKGLYRAISIKENDKEGGKTYTITALQHIPEKESIVINGTHFDPKPQTIYGDVVNADVSYNGKKLVVSGKVNGSFNVLSSKTVATYTVKLLKDGKLVYIKKLLSTPEIEVDDLENGSYEAVIFAYNDKGQLLNQYTKSFVIDRPPVVTGITITSHLSSVVLTWDLPLDDITQTEIWASESNNLNTAQLVERIKGSYYAHEIGAKQVRYYWLRHIRGVNEGLFDQVQGRKGESGIDINAELELLNQELSEPIINKVFDVALPARQLDMIHNVEQLDINTYTHNLVYDRATSKLYSWNGTKYTPVETELLASAIKGIIQPSQLAPIPSEKISGQLTNAQIAEINATKLIGTVPIANVPTIPTNKLTGLLTDAQIQSINATKLTGTIADVQIAELNANKLTGTIQLDNLPTVPTTKLSGQITNEQLASVSANKIAGVIDISKVPTIPTTKLSGTVNIAQVPSIPTTKLTGTITDAQIEQLNASKLTGNVDVARIPTIPKSKIDTTVIRDITQLQSADNAKTQEIANLTQSVNNNTGTIRQLNVTTGDLTQKYTQLKNVTDRSSSEIANILQTQTGQATSIERLGARFDDLSVGGRNLLRNGNFAENIRHWENWGNNSATRNIENQILKLVANNNEPYRGIFQQIFLLDKNTSYILSFEAKSLDDHNLVNVGFYFRNSSNRILSQYWRDITINSEFSKYAITIKTPNDNNFTNINLMIGGKQRFPYHIELRNLKLERGTIATDWTPAPEDVQSEIATKASSADLNTVRQTLANADNALSARIDTLHTNYNGNKSTVDNQLATLSQADRTQAEQIRSMQSTLNGKANASALSNYYTKAETDNVMSGRVEQFRSSLNVELNKLQKALKRSELDLRDLDSNTYYPITFAGISAVKSSLIKIYRNLYDIPEKPIWAKHGSGFAVLCEWVTNANSWGVISISRQINHCEYNWITDNQSPIIGIGQLTSGYREYCYLRGGARYYLETNDYITAFIHRERYTTNGQFVEPIQYNASLVPKSLHKDVTANANAISTLNTNVTRQGETLNIHSTKLTQLESNLGNKANASALQTLDTKVTQQGNLISSEARKLEQLKSEVSVQGTTLRGEISTVSNTVTSLNGQINSTHTIKAQSIAGGRTAIAGISIGTSANNRIAESSVIVLADKFQVAKNTNDNNPVSLFTIADNKAMIHGDLIVNGTITTDKIQANAITSAKIQANAIGTNHIASNAVTAEQIKAGSVNAQKIATNAINATHINANAIGANHIVANAINADKLATNSVTAVKIATNAVTADKILTNAVTADKIATNAITADKILAGAITAGKLATNSVRAVDIQANAITSDKIQANAVTAGKIATDAVEANNIKASAITTTKIATGAVTADQIGADAIIANKIKAGEIKATHLSVNSVGTNALQANAITADKIGAGQITSAKIQSNAINAEHINAGQISADKLAIGLGGNLLQNPIFANGAYGWNRYENTNTGLNANNGLGINNATGTFQGNEYLDTENQYRWQPSFRTYPTTETRFGGIYQDIKLVANTWYILSGYVAAHRGSVGVNIELRDGLTISNITRNYTGNGAYAGYGQGLKDTRRIWIKFRVTANGTARCIFNQYISANQTSAPFTVLRRPMLEECTEYATAPSAWQNAGVTSIHGGSIVTNTITAQQIKAGTITANEIAGGTITADKIAGRTITADKIVAGTLTNNEIRTKSITADRLIITELSALTSNIGTITAGTITGTTIEGNTITGGTINGTEISGGIIRGAKFIGATGDFTGTLQVSSTLGVEVGSYTKMTAFRLISSQQTDRKSCYRDSNNESYEVCSGQDVWAEHWQSEITFDIPSNPEETIILPPNAGVVKSYNPTANGLLGSDGKVLRSSTAYTIIVTVNQYKNVNRWYERNRTPTNYNITMKRHKRF